MHPEVVDNPMRHYVLCQHISPPPFCTHLRICPRSDVCLVGGPVLPEARLGGSEGRRDGDGSVRRVKLASRLLCEAKTEDCRVSLAVAGLRS
eukprot:scaffold21265_cov131-Isochrysis_galbana.AAC.14